MDLKKKLSDYYASPAINQSMLKALLAGIGTYKKEEKNLFAEDPEHFILGQAVDTSLLLPSIFNDLFYISALEKKPSDTIMNIIREAFSKRDTFINIEANKEALWNAINSNQYYMNRYNADFNADTRIEGVIKEGTAYWNEHVIADNKTILSSAEKSTIDTIVESFKTHRHTQQYFNNDLTPIYQADLYFTYSDLSCKALLDYILVDQVNKTIQPIDIKTMGDSTKMFPVSARRHRYDIQLAWYHLALSKINELEINAYTKIDISDYTILPFKFIVESTTSPGVCPLVYTASPTDYITGKYGAIDERGKLEFIHEPIGPRTQIKRIYGYKDAIEKYRWHEGTGIWDMDMELYECKGELELDIFG